MKLNTKNISNDELVDRSGERAQVLTKAVLRTADALGLKNAELAEIIGVSAPTVTRLRQGKAVLGPNDKAFELGALLVRLYRGLASIVGGDDNSARTWLRGPNTALGAAPIDRLKSVSGLTDTVRYVDARRASI